MRPPKIFLDKRATTNGRKSHIHLDNSVRLGLLPPGGEQGQVLTKLTDADYDVYWEDINNLINVTINPIEIDKCLFVSESGDDSTAQIGALHAMWRNVEEAVQAAPPSHTVIVFPGHYFINDPSVSIIKEGISVYVYEGARIKLFCNDGDVPQWFNASGINYFQSDGDISLIASLTPFQVDKCSLRFSVHSFDIRRLEVNNFEINFEDNISMFIGELTSIGSYITFNASGSSFVKNYDLRINTHSTAHNPVSGNQAIYLKEDCDLEVVNITINTVNHAKRDFFYGYLHCENPIKSGRKTILNLQINSFKQSSPNLSTAYAPIISVGDWDSTILNVDIKNAYVSGLLFKTLRNSVFTSGKFKVKATILENTPALPSLFEAHTPNIKMEFDLDIENNSLDLYTIINTVNLKKSVFTGKIKNNVFTGISSPAMIETGYVNDYLLAGTATIETSSGCYIRNMIVLTENINITPSVGCPVISGGQLFSYNIISNTLPDLSNLTFSGLQTSILVDNLLK